MSLEKTFARYTKKNDVLKLDYLADQWKCGIQDIVELLCIHYHDFPTVIFDDLGVYLNYRDTQQWYYEYGYGFTVDGERKFKRHIVGKSQHVDKKLRTSQSKPDQHMSVFMHDNKWKKNYNDKYSKVRAGYLFLELDRAGDLNKAAEDADTFLKRFPYHRGIVTWFSGNTSIHIGIPTQYFGDPIGTNTKVCGRGKLFYNLAQMIGQDIRFDTNGFDPHMAEVSDCMELYEEIYGKTPPDDPQYVRQSLEQFDPNLYNMNSMIRMPGSVHEKTGKPKEPVTLPSFNPENEHIKPYLLALTYLGWEPVKRPGRSIQAVDVRKYDSFVIRFFIEHIEEFDPDNVNSAGWVHTLPSPFYNDTNPDVSVCIDPDSDKFGSYRDFGAEDDNTDFVGFVARIIKKSRRAAMDYIKQKS